MRAHARVRIWILGDVADDGDGVGARGENIGGVFEFDAADGARVVAGPAPRRLPALPLKVEQGFVVAAGPFSSRAGVIQP